MQDKTVAMLNKVHMYLIKHKYVTADDLKKITKLKSGSIYRLIKFMRLKGIGIYATIKGYVLSEFADKRDDVHFIRRINGRRTGDIIAVKSAEKDILHRWNGIQDKNSIVPVLSNLTIQIEKPEKADEGMKYLLTYINGKGL